MLTSLTQMPISRRLPLTMVLIMVVFAAALGAMLYTRAASMQVDSARVTLTGVARDQATAVKSWYDATERHVASTAATPLPARAILQFGRAMIEDADDMLTARRAYIDDNPNPAATRAALDRATDGSSFSEVHAAVHPQLRATVEEFDYRDILLFDSRGRLLYSVAKQDDFGQDFTNGPLADSALGRAYSAAMTAGSGTVITTDFAAYAPLGGAPAAFMATPVLSSTGRPIGVIAFRLSADVLSDLLTRSAALGDHGDMYIVASDGTARTRSRFEGRFKALDPVPGVPFIAALTQGETGFFKQVPGVSGHDSLAATHPVPVDFADWALVSELDATEALAGLATMRSEALLFTALGLIAAVGISFLASRAITRPLGDVVSAMGRVAGGDYTAEVAVARRHDEIGTLGRTLLAFRDQLAEAEQLNNTRAAEGRDQGRVVAELGAAMRALSQGDLTRTIEMDFPPAYETLRHDFNATVSSLQELMMSVADNATEILANADELSAASDDLSRRTEAQAATLEETAAALEELSTSVKSAADKAGEVDRTVQDTRADAEASGEVVKQAVDAMSEIKSSSDGITKIISVIEDIAFQTNLLALNAGVEAARAGQSGQGFAVVASEVRALAQRSTEAAREIKTLISASTTQVESGVLLVNRTGTALAEIFARIGQVSDLVSDIAGGAQEQSIGLGEISIGMSELDKVGQQNAAMVEEGTASSATLKQEAQTLQAHVARFRIHRDTDPARPGPEHQPEAALTRGLAAKPPPPASRGPSSSGPAPRSAASGDSVPRTPGSKTPDSTTPESRTSSSRTSGSRTSASGIPVSDKPVDPAPHRRPTHDTSEAKPRTTSPPTAADAAGVDRATATPTPAKPRLAASGLAPRKQAASAAPVAPIQFDDAVGEEWSDF